MGFPSAASSREGRSDNSMTLAFSMPWEATRIAPGRSIGRPGEVASHAWNAAKSAGFSVDAGAVGTDCWSDFCRLSQSRGLSLTAPLTPASSHQPIRLSAALRSIACISPPIVLLSSKVDCPVKELAGHFWPDGRQDATRGLLEPRVRESEDCDEPARI